MSRALQRIHGTILGLVTVLLTKALPAQESIDDLAWHDHGDQLCHGVVPQLRRDLGGRPWRTTVSFFRDDTQAGLYTVRIEREERAGGTYQPVTRYFASPVDCSLLDDELRKELFERFRPGDTLRERISRIVHPIIERHVSRLARNRVGPIASETENSDEFISRVTAVVRTIQQERTVDDEVVAAIARREVAAMLERGLLDHAILVAIRRLRAEQTLPGLSPSWGLSIRGTTGLTIETTQGTVGVLAGAFVGAHYESYEVFSAAIGFGWSSMLGSYFSPQLEMNVYGIHGVGIDGSLVMHLPGRVRDGRLNIFVPSIVAGMNIGAANLQANRLRVWGSLPRMFAENGEPLAGPREGFVAAQTEPWAFFWEGRLSIRLFSWVDIGIGVQFHPRQFHRLDALTDPPRGATFWMIVPQVSCDLPWFIQVNGQSQRR